MADINFVMTMGIILKYYNIEILKRLEESLRLKQGKAVFLDDMTTEDKGFAIFRNVGNFSSKDTASQTRISDFSASTLLELSEILFNLNKKVT